MFHTRSCLRVAHGPQIPPAGHAPNVAREECTGNQGRGGAEVLRLAPRERTLFLHDAQRAVLDPFQRSAILLKVQKENRCRRVRPQGDTAGSFRYDAPVMAHATKNYLIDMDGVLVRGSPHPRGRRVHREAASSDRWSSSSSPTTPSTRRRTSPTACTASGL